MSIINDYKKYINAVNKLCENVLEETLEHGDAVIFKDKYMSKGLQGIIHKVLPDNKYHIVYKLLSGKVEDRIADVEDLQVVGKKASDGNDKIKYEIIPDEPKVPMVVKKASVVNKPMKAKAVLPVGTMVTIHTGEEDGMDGEFGRIVGVSDNAYEVDVLAGKEPRVYIPKQQVTKA